MEKLYHVPDGLDEIIAHYGNPDIDGDWLIDVGWLAKYTAIFGLPFPLATWNGRTARRFRAHLSVGEVIVDAMKEIGPRRGLFWGGCWWFRKMRGQDFLSTHSWGIAVDINPKTCPMGTAPDLQDKRVVRAFKRRGFDWGGDWDRPDSMHFQACKGY